MLLLAIHPNTQTHTPGYNMHSLRRLLVVMTTQELYISSRWGREAQRILITATHQCLMMAEQMLCNAENECIIS